MNIYPLTVDEQNIELEIALLESEEEDATLYQSKLFFESYLWQLFSEHYATSTGATDGDIWKVR